MIFSRNVWWAVWISSFFFFSEVFYRPEWTQGKGGRGRWEWILTISAPKWMMRTVRAEKLNEKIFMVSMFSSPLIWSLNWPKKCIFSSFVLTSGKNLSLLKQLICMHLKVLITLFQKIVWFTRLSHR